MTCSGVRELRGSVACARLAHASHCHADPSCGADLPPVGLICVFARDPCIISEQTIIQSSE
jgi:hypothetical protein